MKTEKDTRN